MTQPTQDVLAARRFGRIAPTGGHPMSLVGAVCERAVWDLRLLNKRGIFKDDGTIATMAEWPKRSDGYPEYLCNHYNTRQSVRELLAVFFDPHCRSMMRRYMPLEEYQSAMEIVEKIDVDKAMEP